MTTGVYRRNVYYVLLAAGRQREEQLPHHSGVGKTDRLCFAITRTLAILVRYILRTCELANKT